MIKKNTKGLTHNIKRKKKGNSIKEVKGKKGKGRKEGRKEEGKEEGKEKGKGKREGRREGKKFSYHRSGGV